MKALHYVVEQNALVDCAHVVAGIIQAQAILVDMGEGAKPDIEIQFLVAGKPAFLLVQASAKLAKGQGQHLKFHVAAGCGRLPGHETGVGSSQIEVAIFLQKQTVHSLLEIRNMPDLVKEDIRLCLRHKAGFNVAVESPVVPKLLMANILEVDADNPLPCDTVFP